MRRIVLWSAVLVTVVVSGLIVFVRGSGISVYRDPPALERQVAKRAWRFLVPQAAREAVNPAPDSPEVIKGGLEHFADHCAICHANNGTGDTVIGRRVYPPAPDFRESGTQSLTDGELFYAIEQGIPFTAMPGWANGTREGELESWHLVKFIRHLPALTADEIGQMERLNPRSPATDERDREIDDFLRGKSSAPKKMEHRHK
jgi:mono/diheme cytochrome c family protein